MTSAAITTEIQKLEPSAVIELFEMDATAFGGDLLRFHAGTNGLSSNVVWQGNTYTAYPIKATGFELTGNGQLPRPKLTVSNTTGAITLMVLTYDDLLGAKITRKRTMVKYLDAVNYPARRNLLTYSQDFNSWTKSNSTVGSDVDLNPFGDLLADRLIPTTTSGTHSVSRAATAVAIGDVRTFSIYANRSTGERYIRLAFTTTNFAAGSAYFDLDTGAVSNVGSGSVATAVQMSNGWWRLSLTATATTAGTASAIAYSYRAIGTSYAGDGIVGPLLFGAQVDAGSSASDYQYIGASFSQNPTADPTAEFPNDVFFIDRKATETRDLVEFELAASFDVAGVLLPKRQIIQNVCVWKYKGTECGYAGTKYFDANDQPVASSGLDVCGKRLTSCEKRFTRTASSLWFGSYQVIDPLPFGSFPSAGLAR
jgi:phage-related protein